MVELVVDCQALVEPCWDLYALFYQLVKDEVRQLSLAAASHGNRHRSGIPRG